MIDSQMNSPIATLRQKMVTTVDNETLELWTNGAEYFVAKIATKDSLSIIPVNLGHRAYYYQDNDALYQIMKML
jgi:uncharacterized membrane protein